MSAATYREIERQLRAGVDPVEICCRLLVSWDVVEWLAGLVAPAAAEAAAPETAAAPAGGDTDDTEDDAEEPAAVAAIPAAAPSAAGAPITTAALRRAQERDEIAAFVAENGVSTAVDLGAEAPAVEYLRARGFEVYGSPEHLRRQGRWTINSKAVSSAELWRRARQEAARRGETPPKPREDSA